MKILGISRKWDKLEEELNQAERKAWDSLARYKFMMFGYWAAMWIHLNRVGCFKRSNPFAALVMSARVAMKEKDKNG